MPDKYDAPTMKWLGPLLGSQDGDPRDDNERTYGAVWAISDEEEKKIDELEHVGECYTKEETWIEFWSAPQNGQRINLLKKARKVKSGLPC